MWLLGLTWWPGENPSSKVGDAKLILAREPRSHIHGATKPACHHKHQARPIKERTVAVSIHSTNGCNLRIAFESALEPHLLHEASPTTRSMLQPSLPQHCWSPFPYSLLPIASNRQNNVLIQYVYCLFCLPD